MGEPGEQEDANIDALTNELAHLSLQKPLNRYDCVYVTLSKLVGCSVATLGASIDSALRPLPNSKGLAIDVIEAIILELNKKLPREDGSVVPLPIFWYVLGLLI
jgi:hypothetical protein